MLARGKGREREREHTSGGRERKNTYVRGRGREVTLMRRVHGRDATVNDATVNPTLYSHGPMTQNLLPQTPYERGYGGKLERSRRDSFSSSDTTTPKYISFVCGGAMGFTI